MLHTERPRILGLGELTDLPDLTPEVVTISGRSFVTDSWLDVARLMFSAASSPKMIPDTALADIADFSDTKEADARHLVRGMIEAFGVRCTLNARTPDGPCLMIALQPVSEATAPLSCVIAPKVRAPEAAAPAVPTAVMKDMIASLAAEFPDFDDPEFVTRQGNLAIAQSIEPAPGDADEMLHVEDPVLPAAQEAAPEPQPIPEEAEAEAEAGVQEAEEPTEPVDAPMPETVEAVAAVEIPADIEVEITAADADKTASVDAGDIVRLAFAKGDDWFYLIDPATPENPEAKIAARSLKAKVLMSHAKAGRAMIGKAIDDEIEVVRRARTATGRIAEIRKYQ